MSDEGLKGILEAAFKYMNESYGCREGSCDHAANYHSPECCITQDLWKALNIMRSETSDKDSITNLCKRLEERDAVIANLRAAQSSKQEWPSEDEIEAAAEGMKLEHAPERQHDRYVGFHYAIKFIKQRMNQNESKKDGV